MRHIVVVLLAAAGAFAGAFLATTRSAPPIDAAEAYLAANRAEVERMVLEDVEKHGMDVYRLYLEISQAMPGNPGSDFAVDKAVRKLEVTYPDSNVRRLADAHVAYNAIRRRDMLKIEQYLEAAEQTGHKRPLMPNGHEIIPQLVAAQYNYNFHTGRLAEAEKTLDYLAAAHGGSFIFQPQGKSIPVADFIANQRKVLEIIKRKETNK